MKVLNKVSFYLLETTKTLFWVKLQMKILAKLTVGSLSILSKI